jgi:hypothetical protein
MGNLNILDSDRLDVLDRAIRNVLGTEVALETYAQIIDGLPLADVANNQWMGPYGGFVPDHPINRHTSLCPGVLERTEQYRSEFGIHTLEFDENVSCCKNLSTLQCANLLDMLGGQRIPVGAVWRTAFPASPD